jgi:hypothetical protein
LNIFIYFKLKKRKKGRKTNLPKRSTAQPIDRS